MALAGEEKPEIFSLQKIIPLTDFLGEEYKVTYDEDDEMVFAYEEEVTIPASLFTGEEGRISISVGWYFMRDYWGECQITNSAGPTFLYDYQVNGETVTLQLEYVAY